VNQRNAQFVGKQLMQFFQGGQERHVGKHGPRGTRSPDFQIMPEYQRRYILPRAIGAEAFPGSDADCDRELLRAD
jgi:hypothetical protein